MNTGRSSPISTGSVHSNTSNESSGSESTVNSLDLMLHVPTSGKMRHLLDRVLSLDLSPLDETMPRIGPSFGTLLQEAISMRLTHKSVFVITTTSDEFIQTLLDLLVSSETSSFTGVKVEPARRDKLGKTEVWRLILKIHGPNFGMATLIRKLLLSTNLEEVSTLDISSDGSTTGILFLLKSKEVVDPYWPKPSSLLQTYLQESGIPDLTTLPMLLLDDDLLEN